MLDYFLRRPLNDKSRWKDRGRLRHMVLPPYLFDHVLMLFNNGRVMADIPIYTKILSRPSACVIPLQKAYSWVR